MIVYLGLFFLIAFSIWLIGILNAEADWGGSSVNWLDGWTRLICRYIQRLPEQKIALPETGPAIVVANHVSGVDPLLLISASKRPLRFLIAREEYERPIVRWVFKKAGCIPVDRTGRPEQALRQALRALQQGEIIALFPHGKIHLDSDPPRKIKGGVGRLASWSSAPVFPVRIDGVSAQGKVFTAPFVPSRVQLTMSPALHCSTETMPQCLQDISTAIETPASIKKT
jgi:1-acyl-sn-glycerol-3-phosphate acyltransferase